MNGITEDDAIHMVQRLVTLHNSVGLFFDSCADEASPGSQADKELLKFKRRESVISAYGQGTMLIEVAADHLMAFTKTLSEPIQTIAPWTCVRAMLEASAIASWIFDPSLDASTRVQRSFALWHEGLSQQVKFGRARGDDADTAKVLARINEVESQALALGYPRVQNKNGDRIGIGQQMPAITEIIRDVLNEEAAYRLLSAMAHAHHWALQQLSFQEADKLTIQFADDDSSDEAVLILKKHLDPISIAYLCLRVARSLAIPVWYKCQLFGWDTTNLKGIFNAAFDDLRMPLSSRSW